VARRLSRVYVVPWRSLPCRFIYFLKQLTQNWKHLIMAGIIPLIGFAVMAAIFVKAFHDYGLPDAGYAAPLWVSRHRS